MNSSANANTGVKTTSDKDVYIFVIYILIYRIGILFFLFGAKRMSLYIIFKIETYSIKNYRIGINNNYIERTMRQVQKLSGLAEPLL